MKALLPKDNFWISTEILEQLLKHEESSKKLKVVCATLIPPNLKKPGLHHKDFFDKERIPNSMFLDLHEVRDKENSLPTMVPSEEQFQKQMQELDIKTSDIVIFYDDLVTLGAARAWFTFDVFGHKNIYILDGVFTKWKDEKRETETTAPRAIIPGKNQEDYLYKKQAQKVDEFQNILENTKNFQAGKEYIQCVDARPADRFFGKVPEPREGCPSGHVPGAISIPFKLFFEPEKHFVCKTEQQMKEVLQEKKIDISKKIISMCGTGVSAAATYVVLRQLKVKDVTLFDGSWLEYALTEGVKISKEEA